MKRNHSRKALMSLAIALSMASSSLPGSSSAIFAMEQPFVESTYSDSASIKETSSLPAFQAKGGYKRVTLTIDLAQDNQTAYTIWRSETEDGEYVKVGETTEASWNDTNTQSQKTYYYKIGDGETLSANPVSVQTGKQAFAENGEISKTFDEEEGTFDGTRVIDLSSEIDKIKTSAKERSISCF